MDLDSVMNLDSTLPWTDCQKCLKGGRMAILSHESRCKN